MLETKDTAASVLQIKKKNKKRLQKSFSGNLQFIGVARILIGRAQFTNHMQ